MTARQPRFEVVRGDDGWFARFIAANGREVWRTSETYRRQAGARNAVDSIAVLVFLYAPLNRHPEVRILDERTGASS